MSTQLRLTDLRPGGTHDLPAVAALMADAFDPRFGEAWTSAQCMGMLALPGVALMLADQDGLLAGFALSRVVVDDGELLLLAVRPQVRGRGIGTALLRAVIADARERGAGRVHLEMRSGNSAAALYRAHGFTQVGARRDYYRGGQGERFDALTLSLTL
ncbi:ribosomal-protein-alanine N-acetyltransferase [Sphingomonas guangdongensis]|uniref:Ribosomal-protein-alanine N-acetyltransferase n=1 Tax=Sphingomonas guangdongensis TaxID=1141890 RepID=A0A285QFA3_9SPHN|nr:ribosomal protein S18-alanine N-acetyltransferase [Sphingomonas guangdongensis]SOB80610.1 ribosomal-protein-alanine N-acetyltransferase [Sphingomonas guangdongensis]